jgi:hypothetical protein
MAMIEETKITKRREYPNWLPPAISVDQFPANKKE